MTSKETIITNDEIARRLTQQLPLWTYEDGWLKRTYKTHSWKGTLMAVTTIGHLAESAWHHPDMTLSYAWLEVRLKTHSAKGITEKDFALAKRIEDVIAWQPDENDPFEGTPQDARFAYIKYDRK